MLAASSLPQSAYIQMQQQQHIQTVSCSSSSTDPTSGRSPSTIQLIQSSPRPISTMSVDVSRAAAVTSAPPSTSTAAATFLVPVHCRRQTTTSPLLPAPPMLTFMPISAGTGNSGSDPAFCGSSMYLPGGSSSTSCYPSPCPSPPPPHPPTSVIPSDVASLSPFVSFSTVPPPPPPPPPPSFPSIFSPCHFLPPIPPPPTLSTSRGDFGVFLPLAAVPPPPPVPPPPSLPLPGAGLQQVVGAPGRTPRTKLRRLQWQKIPPSRVLQSATVNVWTQARRQFLPAATDQHQPLDDITAIAPPLTLDFERVEELFAVGPSPSSAVGSVGSAGTLGRSRSAGRESSSSGTLERKKTDQVDLFDSRRSLNINIFLRQFRSPTYDDLVSSLATADSERIGAEKLRALVKCLPDDDEMEKVLQFTGDPSQLGNAERFCRELASLSYYRLRIEALLMKEEFNQSIDWLKPSIDAIIITARDLRESKTIRDILFAVLLVGNFLNAGGYAGDAAGFRLQTLLTLNDIRSNGGRFSLLHYIVSEIEKQNPNVIKELQQIKYLKEAAQSNIETISADISSLREKLKHISSQISCTNDTFRQQMESFLEFAGDEMSELESDLRELESLRCQLAAYFCEDEQTFQLDECIRTFSRFVDSFIKASQENNDRRLLEEKAEERRRQRAEHLNAKQQTHKEVQTLKRNSLNDQMLSSSTANLCGSLNSRESCPTFQSTSANNTPKHCVVSRRSSSVNGRSASVTNSAGKISSSDLGGFGDVVGNSGIESSTQLDCSDSCNSVSSLTKTRSRMLDNAASEDDLFDYLLQSHERTSSPSFSSDSLPRRRRRGKTSEVSATGMERERTASPMLVSAELPTSASNPEFGAENSRRRRSLPVPREADIASTATVRPVPHRKSSDDGDHSADGNGVEIRSTLLGRQQRSGSLLGDIQENVIAAVVLKRDDDKEGETEHNMDNDTVSEKSQHGRKNADVVPSTSMSGSGTVCIELQHTEKDKGIGNEPDRGTRTMYNEDESISQHNEEDEFTDSFHRRSQSLRLRVHPALTASTASGTASTSLRSEVEAQLLDTKVHEFQARSCPEREAMKNRLKRLSQIYSLSGDEESRTWPIPRNNRRYCLDLNYSLNAENSVSSFDMTEKQVEAQQFSKQVAEISRKTDEMSKSISQKSSLTESTSEISNPASQTSSVTLSEGKSEVDSLSKDEGFETSSLSSDQNMTSSQRSSMCDCDATLTPTSENKPQSLVNSDSVTSELVVASQPANFSANSFGVCTKTVVAENISADAKENPVADETTTNTSPTTSLEIPSEIPKNICAENVVDCCGKNTSDKTQLKGSLSAVTLHNNTLKRSSLPAAVTASPKQVLPPARKSSLQSRIIVPTSLHHSSPSRAAETSTRSSSSSRSTPVRGSPARSTVSSAASAVKNLAQPKPENRQHAATASPARTAAATDSNFVRFSASRVTIAAPELRSNKKLAAEARSAKAVQVMAPHCGSGSTAAAAAARMPSATTSKVTAPVQPQRLRTPASIHPAVPTASSTHTSQKSTTAAIKSHCVGSVSALRAPSTAAKSKISTAALKKTTPEAESDLKNHVTKSKLLSRYSSSATSSKLYAPSTRK